MITARSIRLSIFGPLTCSPRRCFLSSSASRKQQWGFIGLGRMGYPMAKNLRAKIPEDNTLLVYDVNREMATQLQAESGGNTVVAESCREVALHSETVFTVLPEGKHVKQVFEQLLDPSLPALSTQRLFIDCSTIDPMTSRTVAASVSSHPNSNSTFVDAPMSGGVVGARAGQLTFMLGSPPDLVPRIQSSLSHLGRKVIHCGPQGLGLSAKLANNYLLAISNIATAEAMTLGVRWGLDPRVLASVINQSSGRCWASEVNNPVPGVVGSAPASRRYEGGFGVGLMAKDLRLAREAAADVGVKLRLDGEAAGVYGELQAKERFNGKDFSVVYELLNQEEGEG